MKIFFVRHPQTEWNKEKKMQGWLDSPLTEEGRAIAHMLGEKLKEKGIRSIVASDLGRCKETATIINEYLHIPLILSEGFREQNFGKWVGGPRTDAILKQIDENPKFAPPGGESRHHMHIRWMNALQKTEDHTLIVTHEGCMMTFLSTILHKSIGDCRMKQNEIITVEQNEGSWKVIAREQA